VKIHLSMPDGWWLHELTHLHGQVAYGKPARSAGWRCTLRDYPAGVRMATGTGRHPQEAVDAAIKSAKGFEE
jgi:hypothetical protein